MPETGFVPKVAMFKGHCLKGLGDWKEAHDAYVRAVNCREFATDKSENGLEALTRFCTEARNEGKPDRLARKDGERRKVVAQGLFRRGTFGNLPGGREEAAVDDDNLSYFQLNRLYKCFEAPPDAEVKDAPGPGGALDDSGQDSGDGKEDRDKESEIDWLFTGARQHDLMVASLQLGHRYSYPPLRYMRGRLISRT